MKKRITAVILICMIIAGCMNSVHVSAGVSSDSDFFVPELIESEKSTEETIEAAGSSETAESPETAEPEKVAPPKLKNKKITLEVGKKTRIEVIGGSGEITWESTKPQVVKVMSNGKIKAVSKGTAKIKGRMDGKLLSLKVTAVETKTIKIKAVGDNLYHQRCIDSGLKSNGSRNYDKIYSAIAPYIADADIRIINQETMFVKNEEDYSGYPSFGTPVRVGDAMRKAGFNVITLATNHSNDKHETGILTTTNYWGNYKDDILAVGMFNNSKDYNTIQIREYNGIKVAFLNYTYGMNGYKCAPLSGKYSEKMNETVKWLNEKNVIADIKEARKKADVVVVLPHWGEEYHLEANEKQKNLAQKMADAGATCIIGTHPHVIEPLEILTASDGRKVPCYYSLGNFVSNMFSLDTQLEAMAEITIKSVNGEIYVESAKITPLVNHINKTDTEFTVYRLEDYTSKLAAGHVSNVGKSEPEITIDKLWGLFRSVVGFESEFLLK